MVVDAIMSISGVAFAAGGVTIGALVLFSIISGPVGWAILGSLALATTAIAAIGLIIALIDSFTERDVSVLIGLARASY